MRSTREELTAAAAPVISELPRHQLEIIAEMNRTIFGEERIINTFARDDLLVLLATVDGVPAGFKIGYRENRLVFYSAKGGVLPAYRRRGIARVLLYDMMNRVAKNDYRRFAFDTFPNRHPGMAILALNEGFRVTRADYNPTYRDYRIRFEADLPLPRNG